MIFGRPTNLWLGAIIAVFNLFVLFHIGGFDPSSDQINGVNIALSAVIILIANTPPGDNTPKVLAGAPEKH